jgi:hypothetical protein
MFRPTRYLQGIDGMTDVLEALNAVTNKVLRYQPPASAEIRDMKPQLDLHFGRPAGNRDSSDSMLLAA